MMVGDALLNQADSGRKRALTVKAEKRQKALDEIREHIAKYGFHTYVVTGGGDPHFGYTIGRVPQPLSLISLNGSTLRVPYPRAVCSVS